MKASDFFPSIAADTVAATKGTGLFPSVMMGQAALEGGYGESLLAKKYNNHFGIKASAGWHGSIVALDTTEYVHDKPIKVKSDFRSYDNRESGFADRVRFLQVNPRYAKAGVFAAKTPEDQLKALIKAGYATDPNYVSKVMAIIKANNLTKYDGTQPATPAAAPADTKKK